MALKTKGAYARRSLLSKYTVYDNRTDMPFIISGTARECAAAMGITVETFYWYLSPEKKRRTERSKKGTTKWWIGRDDDEIDDD